MKILIQINSISKQKNQLIGSSSLQLWIEKKLQKHKNDANRCEIKVEIEMANEADKNFDTSTKKIRPNLFVIANLFASMPRFE